MTRLTDKIKHALDESLILITGVQIILGFDYQGTFEKGFDKLPAFSRYLKLGSLTIMLVAIALLLMPVAYHRIVSEGEATEDFHRFSKKIMLPALLPFALGLGIDLYITTEKLAG